jgi:hypothetical protein
VLESIFVVFLVIYIAVRLISTVNIKFLRENREDALIINYKSAILVKVYFQHCYLFFDAIIGSG